MATFISGAFTATDRRKKAVTYGKSSRLPPKPVPLPSDEAPSPDRPRKHIAKPCKSTEKPMLEYRDANAISMKDTKDLEIFDVPSEDELDISAQRHVGKVQAKRIVEIEKRPKSLQSREPDSKTSIRQSAKLHAEPKRVAGNATARSTKSTTSVAQFRDPPSTKGTENVRSLQLSKKSSKKHDVDVRQPTKVKAQTLSTMTVIPTSQRTEPANIRSANPMANRLKPRSVQRETDLDIFDLPLSDDETHVPCLKPIRRAPSGISSHARLQIRERARLTSAQPDSDGSAASNKLKRKSSDFASTAQIPPNGEGETGTPLTHSRKYRKQENSTILGLDVRRTVAQPEAYTINKPKRTRTRTVPVIERPAIAQGQSSPANLQTMISHESPAYPLAVLNEGESIAPEHDTMYEIPELPNTPLRSSSTNASGSVTPRQKALFGSLLGSSSSTTPMPNLASLQLTASKPRSLLGGLVRSKCDMPNNLPTSRVKLLGQLQRASSESNEASESESSNESEEGEGDTIVQGDSPKLATAGPHAEFQPSLKKVESTLDLATATSQNSQASQGKPAITNRQRLTYAKARSYLQEANEEDALLMSMDIDEPLSRTVQNRNDFSEDEEDSQVRANHELKEQGQHNTFEWEMLIDDMSPSSSSGVRRSALLEFSTKMADASFTHQMLDSTLAQRFLRNIGSNGEVIFDFAATVATIFMLRTGPTFTMLDQIQRSTAAETKFRLLDLSRDIQKVAKDRKSNLSKISQESVLVYRSIVQQEQFWTPWNPAVISPQLVMLKAIELEILESRNAGTLETVVNQEILAKLIDMISKASVTIQADRGTAQEDVIVETILSALEAISSTITSEDCWSRENLQSLACSLPICFEPNQNSECALAVKLCMNITNNRPTACQQFSNKRFVQPLSRAIVRLFGELQNGPSEQCRTESRESLILSLGAMINLAEHSDSARTSLGTDKILLQNLVETFLDGSARAAKADSMEETQSSVAVGYLGVLLGNICLNEVIRSDTRALLPGRSLTVLVHEIQEFIRIHEQVNRRAKQYEGEEGQQTWQEYTARLLLVVDKLAMADA